MKKQLVNLRKKVKLLFLALFIISLTGLIRAQTCVAGFLINTNTPSNSCNYNFSSNSYSGNFFYTWNFGDGTNVQGNTGYNYVAHSYANGSYTVTHHVYTISNTITPCITTQSIIIVSGCGNVTQANFNYVNMGASSNTCADQMLTDNSTGQVLYIKWILDNGQVFGPMMAGYEVTVSDYLSAGVHSVTLCAYATSNTAVPTSTFTNTFTVCALGSTSCSAALNNLCGFYTFCDSIWLYTTEDPTINYHVFLGDGTDTTYYGDNDPATRIPLFYPNNPATYTMTILAYVPSNSMVPCATWTCEVQISGCITTGFSDAISKSINLSIYPTPITDELIIEMITSPKKISYQLVDALGKVILKNNIVNYKTNINTSDVNSGFYTLNILDDNNVIISKKVVKINE